MATDPSQGFHKTFWAEKRQLVKDRNKAGVACIFWYRGHIHVNAPYSETFVAEAHALDGYWRHRSLAWTFSADKWDAVLKLCREIYGYNKLVVKRGGFPRREA